MKKSNQISEYDAAVTAIFKNIKTQQDLSGLVSNLLKNGVEAILKAEMDEHLGYNKNELSNSDNSRNGYSSKTVRSNLGDLALSIPRDRNATFEPQLIPKNQRMIDKIEDVIIGLYARGMTTSDIEEQIRELYGIDVSPATVSNITNRVIEYMRQWQNRPLNRVYLIAWMDCIQIKVRENGKVSNKSIYLNIGLTKEGMKEILGMWISQTESASFWLSVTTDLKARGVEDIFIVCTDNLKGFKSAVNTAFPLSTHQLCVVHQIRNSLRYVVWTDKKEFASDLKNVYNAVNQADAQYHFEIFKQKWNAKYSHSVKSWENNWAELTAYFEYPAEIRTIIYTTNAIESLNSQIRKYTNNRVVFPDDNAALKAVYLSINLIERKWTMPIRNWGAVLNQFLIIFENRIKL